MDRQQLSQFVSHYQNLNEDALFELHERSNDLTEEAREALRGVIAERKIDVAKIAIDRKADDTAYQSKIEATIEKNEKRDAKWTKIYIFVAIPVCIVAALLRPDRAYETFISAVGQAVLLGLLSWLVLVIRRAKKGRTK